MFKDNILNSITEITKNYEVFLVGGYLRNYFINNEISPDRDLVVIKHAKKLAQEIAQKLKNKKVDEL